MLRTILIADDDANVRAWLTRLLEGAGYDVIPASTLEEGKRVLAIGGLDLLITDVRMGGFNGLQLVAMNRERIPAIVITGHDDPVIAKEARLLGADFLVKPLESAALLRIVEAKLKP